MLAKGACPVGSRMGGATKFEEGLSCEEFEMKNWGATPPKGQDCSANILKFRKARKAKAKMGGTTDECECHDKCKADAAGYGAYTWRIPRVPKKAGRKPKKGKCFCSTGKRIAKKE